MYSSLTVIVIKKKKIRYYVHYDFASFNIFSICATLASLSISTSNAIFETSSSCLFLIYKLFNRYKINKNCNEDNKRTSLNQ